MAPQRSVLATSPRCSATKEARGQRTGAATGMLRTVGRHTCSRVAAPFWWQTRTVGFGPVIAAVVNAPLAEVVGRYKSEAVVVDVEGVVNRVLACLPLTRQRTLPVTEPATLHCPQRELGSPAVT